jgi:hypothetical protein
MSGSILSSRPGQQAPLPPLGPGERLIDGRVYHSSAWLGAAPFEPGPVRIEPASTTLSL